MMCQKPVKMEGILGIQRGKDLDEADASTSQLGEAELVGKLGLGQSLNVSLFPKNCCFCLLRWGSQGTEVIEVKACWSHKKGANVGLRGKEEVKGMRMYPQARG